MTDANTFHPTLTLIISSGIVSFAVAIATIFVSLGKYKEKIDMHEKSLHNQEEKMMQAIQRIEDKISDLSRSIAKLEGGIDRDREHFKMTQSNSPITLTDYGKASLWDSNGKDYLDKNKQYFIDLIKSKSPKTAYDVQELCKKLINEHSNDDGFTPIKDFVYKKGIKLDEIIEAMGIYLRDIALKELGFKISDIKD